DARATLEELIVLLSGYTTPAPYREVCDRLHREWEAEVDRIYAVRHSPLPSQGELLGAINDLGDPDAVMINAAGSMPGDLHKLWRCRHSKQFHMEYGFSCMGYEIAGGLGIKMADPSREVYVLVGDGSYLMLGNEIITSIQENRKLTVILMDNSGFNSIGGLSRSLGQEGFGTRYIYPKDGRLHGDDAGADAETLPVDLAMNARGLGAHVIECATYDEFVAALRAARDIPRTTVIHIRNDRYAGVGGYESWWDVPPAEISSMPGVQEARRKWESNRTKERNFL
ncbi:MAG: thiamine pyrophosphate-dependent enzyme, partial [Limisphaerales bacterium]